jgi:uncharacterized membrane protein
MFQHISVVIRLLMTWKLNARKYFLDSADVRQSFALTGQPTMTEECLTLDICYDGLFR